MALSTSVHDLRTLIRSSHPLVVIETVEEERVLALLQSVTAQERMPLFEWSITRGLTRADEGATLSKMTATPLAVLQHLHGLTVEAVFWLKDLGPHLQDPAVCRQLREVAAHLQPITGHLRTDRSADLATNGPGQNRGATRAETAGSRRTSIHATGPAPIAGTSNVRSPTLHNSCAQYAQLDQRDQGSRQRPHNPGVRCDPPRLTGDDAPSSSSGHRPMHRGTTALSLPGMSKPSCNVRCRRSRTAASWNTIPWRTIGLSWEASPI